MLNIHSLNNEVFINNTEYITLNIYNSNYNYKFKYTHSKKAVPFWYSYFFEPTKVMYLPFCKEFPITK